MSEVPAKPSVPSTATATAKTKKLDKPRLRVLVRNIPPNITQDEFLKSLHFPPYSSFKFCRGDSSYGAQRVCRAYFSFNHPHEVIVFNKKVDGLVFEDKLGIKKQLVVEFAPLQKLPPPPTRKDKLEGTIDADPLFQQFVTNLSATTKDSAADVAEASTENATTADGKTSVERVLLHLQKREQTKKNYMTGATLTPLMQALLPSAATKQQQKSSSSRTVASSSKERLVESGASGKRSQSKTSTKSSSAATAGKTDSKTSVFDNKAAATAAAGGVRKKKERTSVKDAERYFQHARSSTTANTTAPETEPKKFALNTTKDSVAPAVTAATVRDSPSKSSSQVNQQSKPITTYTKSSSATKTIMQNITNQQKVADSTVSHIDSSEKAPSRSAYYGKTTDYAVDDTRRTRGNATDVYDKQSPSVANSRGSGKAVETVPRPPKDVISKSTSNSTPPVKKQQQQQQQQRKPDTKNFEAEQYDEYQSSSSAAARENSTGLRARPALQLYKPPVSRSTTNTQKPSGSRQQQQDEPQQNDRRERTSQAEYNKNAPADDDYSYYQSGDNSGRSGGGNMPSRGQAAASSSSSSKPSGDRNAERNWSHQDRTFTRSSKYRSNQQ